MLKVITMTAFRRPDYTRQVLAALSQCDDVSSWMFMPCVEPSYDSVVSQFKEFDACEIRLQVNRVKMGLNQNTYGCVSRAANAGADIMVHLEDDIVLSRDALSYFEWAITEIVGKDVMSKDGHHVSIASGYNKPSGAPPEDLSYTATARPIFNCWGWGTDLKRVQWMLKHWCFKDPTRFSTPFRKKFRRTRREVFPILSRVQNIGVLLGMNDSIAGRRKHVTPFVADLPSAPFTYVK